MLDVAPNLVAFDEADQTLGHAVVRSDISLRSWVAADGSNLRVSELPSTMCHTVRVALLGECVLHVDALITSEQVFKFVAGGVVAFVQDMDAAGDWPVGVYPCLAVNVVGHTLSTELAVAGFGSRTGPYFAGLHSSFVAGDD